MEYKTIAEKWAESIVNDPNFKKFLEDDFDRWITTGETRVFSKELLKEMTEFIERGKQLKIK